MPEVSVIMPTYNVEKYIDEAVESILNQTYTNFEFIIVDDYSTDFTFQKLENWAQKDDRILLLRNNRNMKICYTLNRALNMAKGNYIVRMDGDDVSEPDRIEKLYEYLLNHKDVDLVGSQTITIVENGKEIGRKTYLLTPDYIEKGNRYCPCVVHIWMAKKQMYDCLHGYRDIPYAEDYDFLLRGSNQGFKYGNRKEYLYKVRIREGNTATSNGLRQRKAAEYVKALNRIEKREDKSCYSECDYTNAIRTSTAEEKKYIKGMNNLQEAIKTESCLKKPYYIIKGVLSSGFIRKYIFDAIIIRLLILQERVFRRMSFND